MAARENQGYLIAVIILVLITLVLSLSTFFAFSKAQELSDLKTNAETDLLVQTKMREAHQIEAGILRAYVGELGPSVAEVSTQMDSLDMLSLDSNLSDAQKLQISGVLDGVKEVRTAYENDMKMYIAAAAGEDEVQEQTWRSLARNLSTVLADKHNAVNVQVNEISRIIRESNSEIAAKEKTVKETQKLLETARTELDSEKQRNSSKETELKNSLDAVKTENDKVVRSLQDTRDELDATVKTTDAQIAVLKKEKAEIKSKLDDFQQENFDLHDGKIVRVAHKIDRVYVNLGTSDGLRRNLSFAVYDQSVTNFEKDHHKAMIEITRVTGPHQSEARITLEDPLNPILPEDFILTATWDPGYQVPIALIGLFDLDGDGNSDRLQLVQMIENNGGKVVAMHDEDGNIIGKIDAKTRYAVMGEAPQPGTESSTKINDAIRSLDKQSKQSTVQQIDLRKLLLWMGRHGKATVQRLDSEIGTEHRRRKPASSLKSDDR